MNLLYSKKVHEINITMQAHFFSGRKLVPLPRQNISFISRLMNYQLTGAQLCLISLTLRQAETVFEVSGCTRSLFTARRRASDSFKCLSTRGFVALLMTANFSGRLIKRVVFL